MTPLLDADSYALGLVGLPFVVAASALAAVLLYALFMRGAPHLRAPIILFSSGLLPFVVGFGLAVAAPDDVAAHAFFRFGIAFVPLAATGAMVFELALAGRLRAYRAPVILAAAVALVFLALGLTTDLAVARVIRTPSGLRFFAAGPMVLPATLTISVVSVTAFVEALRAARRATSPLRRRQLWGGLVALAVSFMGMSDVLLAYGVGYVPLSWLFVTIGSLLALRSILQDDLLRAQSLDSRAPVAFLALSLSGAAAWGVARYAITDWPAWVAAGALMLGALGARLTVALLARLWSIRAPGEGPLDRLVTQYATRVRQLTRVDEVAALTREVCEIGVGNEVEVITPARDDWSWRRADGTAIEGDHVPDPLLGPWLAERRRPLFLGEIEGADLADLRPSIERLMAAHGAAALVPLIVRDELVGLLVLRQRGRGAARRPLELRFLGSIADRAGAALDYVRIADEAADRAELVRDVELAAAVQAGFVPGPEPSRHHGVTVVGSWQPASECGGDWWSRYALSGGRTLIVIGDVTGSGVAAAMVTAAARGACDAAVLARPEDLDVLTLLHQLDHAVRQVGAGRFHLTCFAAVLDPVAGEIHFANAGHVAPYVCRPRATVGANGDTVELSALVARGNPLGAGAQTVAKLATRPIAAGDVVIWYTDGLIECHGADGKQFGDRRLQRVLRRLGEDELDPVAVQRRLAGELAAHLGGLPIDDDMTLVVARIDGGARA
ncbi:MAG: SpoIIE family protein phosphatase [Myxococcales bacterium]|nr:SpoIIE family protein phosphatase [Myxococcales bacterium]